MVRSTPVRTFTVRIPAELHRAAADEAARKNVSLNALVQEALTAYLRRQEEDRLFESYTRLGEELPECDVEFAWDAQREAIDRGVGRG